MFYRERAAGMYGPYPMAIAMGNVEIPYILVQTVVCEQRCRRRCLGSLWGSQPRCPAASLPSKGSIRR